MPRGGRRTGTAGTAYSNRSDLALPPTAAPNQPYGVAGRQVAAQNVIPMAPSPSPASGLPAAPGTPQPMPAGPSPGSLGDFARASDRPGEHVLNGAPTGPGPGPDALRMSPTGMGGISAVIAQAASASGSSDLALLAQRAQALGQ